MRNLWVLDNLYEKMILLIIIAFQDAYFCCRTNFLWVGGIFLIDALTKNRRGRL